MKLTQAELYDIRTRIEDVVKLKNQKYIDDIGRIINVNKQGIRRLNTLTVNEYLELVQYLDNVESKQKDDYSID